ncbi:B3 domain-containing protein At5g60140-like [Diospyros lotus]|uniref:B3 domain-containing protein At5g60140-like n=1 Tax=Diospyros lotus TaxID=55363 RepID=UPI002256DA6D|nr:B3 domain-containing protein At5g60140-like [Diospyros lotus]
MEKIPGFFKILLLPESSEKLLIPLAFVAYVKEVLPKHVFLRNSDDKLWPIDIGKIGNKFFFKNGWLTFIEGNFIENGDFLTFDYDGDNVFDFQIYGGRNGVRKQEIRSLNSIIEEDEDYELEEEEDSDDEDEKYKGMEEAIDEEELGPKALRKKALKGKGGNEGVEEVIDEEELGAKAFRQKTLKGKEGNSAKDLKSPSKGTNRLLDFDGSKGKVGSKVQGGQKRNKYCDEEDVFKYGMVSRPKNPYFVATVRDKRKNELYVPQEVLRDHHIKLPQTIILLDERGREWTTNVIVWGDGRTWLTRGWRAFCKWNNFKPEDRCICEFKQEESQQSIYLEMRILREGSWLPKTKNQKKKG